eukprot:Rhum_TRINITY_DN24914_c0_g1::Rhum_TRINITY_DN24914_c0_g1_i1::g.180532::m.180532
MNSLWGGGGKGGFETGSCNDARLADEPACHRSSTTDASAVTAVVTLSATLGLIFRIKKASRLQNNPMCFHEEARRQSREVAARTTDALSKAVSSTASRPVRNSTLIKKKALDKTKADLRCTAVVSVIEDCAFASAVGCSDACKTRIRSAAEYRPGFVHADFSPADVLLSPPSCPTVPSPEHDRELSSGPSSALRSPSVRGPLAPSSGDCASLTSSLTSSSSVVTDIDVLTKCEAEQQCGAGPHSVGGGVNRPDIVGVPAHTRATFVRRLAHCLT